MRKAVVNCVVATGVFVQGDFFENLFVLVGGCSIGNSTLGVPLVRIPFVLNVNLFPCMNPIHFIKFQ